MVVVVVVVVGGGGTRSRSRSNDKANHGLSRLRGRKIMRRMTSSR